MRNAPLNARRGLFALVMAGSLGFGATQAVATPAAELEKPSVCDPRCKTYCQGFGGELRDTGCLCCG